MFNTILFIAAGLALFVSWRRDGEKTRKAVQIAQKSFINLLPGMLGIIGLMLALLPGKVISRFFGNDSLAVAGVLVISLIGSITLIPAFIGFPLASSLIEVGAGITAVACFITTVLMVGVIIAPMEIEHFSARFTVIRNGSVLSALTYHLGGGLSL